MKGYPKVSIIIPLYVIEDRFFDDLKKFEKLKYPNYEILVVCHKNIKLTNSKARLIKTGSKPTGPAEKRDLALKYAKGSFCAFIDDDAYPDPGWLTDLVREFKNPNIAAVGGPGLTPPEDSFWSQMTGLVYQSFFCGGPTQHRFTKSKKRYVNDYPAYNLIVRTAILKKVGGYGSYFYGGEDTFLCLKIIKAGYKILYSPKFVVYHHRRPLFKSYLKQIANVGKHRGYFAKKFPETSRHWAYFIPSILTLGFICLLLLSLFNIRFLFLFGLIFILLFLIGILPEVRKVKIWELPIIGVSIVLTHLAYGWSFMKGLGVKKLDV